MLSLALESLPKIRRDVHTKGIHKTGTMETCQCTCSIGGVGGSRVERRGHASTESEAETT